MPVILFYVYVGCAFERFAKTSLPIPKQPGTSSCGTTSHTSTSICWNTASMVGINSTPKLILQVFNVIELRTAGRPLSPLHAHIVEVMSDDANHAGCGEKRRHLWGQSLVSTGIYMQTFISILWVCLPSWRALFFPEKQITSPHQQSSKRCPHLLHMLTQQSKCRRAESGLIADCSSTGSGQSRTSVSEIGGTRSSK